MKILLITFLIVLFSSMSLAGEPLNCQIGPIEVTLGGNKWQLSSCNDNRSLVFVTMQGNPAMPFVFFVHRNGSTSKINGEGSGPKKYSAAAFEELKIMNETRFNALVQATKKSGVKQ